MSYVNTRGYLTKRKCMGAEVTQDWWMIKAHGFSARIILRDITFPISMLGKKVKFKMEVIEDENRNIKKNYRRNKK